MTDRINLADLRVAAGHAAARHLPHGEEVLALLDAVEAAQAVREHDDNDPRPLRPALEKMYERLEVFDFGGAT